MKVISSLGRGNGLTVMLLLALCWPGLAEAQQKPPRPGPEPRAGAHPPPGRPPPGTHRRFGQTQQKRMGFLIQIYDKAGLLAGPPKVLLHGSMGTKRTLFPRDDGSRKINDITKGDGVYCHPVLSFPDPSVQITVHSKTRKWTTNTTLDPDDVRALVFVKLTNKTQAEVLPKEHALGMAVHVPPKEMGAPRPKFGRTMGKYIDHKEKGHKDKGHKEKGHTDKGHTDKDHVDRKHVDKKQTGEKVVDHKEKGHVDRNHVDRNHVDKSQTGEKKVDHQERKHIDRRHTDYDSSHKLAPNIGRMMGKQGPPQMGRMMGKKNLLISDSSKGKGKQLIPSMIGEAQDPREGRLGPGYVLWAVTFVTLALGFSVTVALSGRRPRAAARLAAPGESQTVAPTRLSSEDVAQALQGPLKDYRVVLLGDLMGEAGEADEENLVRCVEQSPLPEELVVAVERIAAVSGPPPALLVTDAQLLDRPGPPDPLISLDRRVASRFPLWVVDGPPNWQTWPEAEEG